MGLLSRKLCRFLLMFSTGFTSLSVVFLFPLSIMFFVFRHCFYAISSNIDEVLSIKPYPNVFVSRDFNIHHKDLPCPGRTDRPGKLCDNLKWPYADNYFSYLDSWLTLLFFWIYFFLLKLAFVAQWHNWEILIMLIIDKFPIIHRGWIKNNFYCLKSLLVI